MKCLNSISKTALELLLKHISTNFAVWPLPFVQTRSTCKILLCGSPCLVNDSHNSYDSGYKLFLQALNSLDSHYFLLDSSDFRGHHTN